MRHPHPGGTSGPLAGIRVIDLTTSYAGPTASMYLADLGADVIKVEKPSGDDARFWGPPFVNGHSAWYASANRRKRSIGIHLSTTGGREILHRLVETADVFMHNMNPGKLERLGLDATTIRRANARLIYCAISGFGADGPAHAQAGYDLAAQARSGLMSVTGAAGGPGQRVSTALSDIVTGMCAALAISAAAVRQQATGQGEIIDVSLLDSDLALMAPRIAAYLAGEDEPSPSGGTDSVLAVYQSFQTSDRDIVIAIGNDQMWTRFALALGLTELAEDPELADNAGRRIHRSRVLPAIQEVLRRRPAAYWLETLTSQNVPASWVQTLSEVVRDEQVVAREAVVPIAGEDGLFAVQSPFRLASSEHGPAYLAGLGEHASEILQECGFSAEQVDEFLDTGAAVTFGEREEAVGVIRR